MWRGVHDPALEIDRASRRTPSPPRSARSGPRQRARRATSTDAHALAAAAGDRLHHQRVADARRLRARSPRRSRRRRAARRCRARPARRRAIATSRAPVLLPISAIASGDGPMNVSPASRHARGERGVLGEEPVAGMHGVGAGRARRRRSACRCGGSSRRRDSARCGPPGPRRARAARRGRSPNRRPPSGCPARGTRG